MDLRFLCGVRGCGALTLIINCGCKTIGIKVLRNQLRSREELRCRSAAAEDCCSSAASNRKSRRSCFADSRRSLATSDIDTASPPLLVMNSRAISRNSRQDSKTRMDRVCC
jgi:hypothetical protein